MRKAFLLGVLALAALVSCSKGGNDPRLVIITFDGLRWQELYGGADEALINDTRFVGNVNALKEKYWRETAEERREALMPFLWSYAPEHGYMLGNRTKNSRMQVDNTMNFSYPGYSEMFCGWADNERVNSNDPVPNPNVSVMEVVNQDPRYKRPCSQSERERDGGRESGSPLQRQGDDVLLLGDDVLLLGEHPFCHEQRPRRFSGQQRP